MSANLEAMQATISAIGEAVAELSAVCERLPQFLENQINGFRAEMSSTMRAMQDTITANNQRYDNAVEAVQARQAEVEGQFQLFGEQSASALEAGIAGLGTIIADNRSVVDAMGENLGNIAKSVLELTGALELNVTSTGKTLEALVESDASVRRTLGDHSSEIFRISNGLVEDATAVGELRTALQTASEATTSTLNSNKQELLQVVNATGERLDASVKGAVVELLEAQGESITTQVQVVRESIGAELAAMAEKSTALVEDSVKTFESISQDLTSVKERITAVDERATVTGQQIVQLQEQIVQTKAENGEHIGELMAANARSTETLLESIRSVSEDVTAAGTRMDEQAQTLTAVVESVTEVSRSFTEVSELVLQSKAETGERIGQLIESNTRNTEVLGTQLLEQATTQINGLATAVEEKVLGLASSIEQTNKEVGLQFVELDKDLSGKVKAVDETLRGMFDAQEKTVSDMLAGTTEVYANSHRALDEKAEQIREHVGTVQQTLLAAHEGTANKFLQLMQEMDLAFVQRLSANAEHAQTDIAKAVEGLASAESVATLAQDMTGRVAEVETTLSARFEEKVGTIAEHMVKAQIELVESSHAAFSKLLEEKLAGFAPGITPEQMAELHVKLAASLPEATPVMPEITIDTAYVDEGLQVTVNYGEKSATAVVPVDIGVHYMGVYKKAGIYRTGDMVSHKGSIWVSNGVPTDEPGKDFTGWRLAVKCGRDGKDARPIKTHVGHKEGTVYEQSDFLRLNNRLWQCAAVETKSVPDSGEITSTNEWILIGGVQ